MPDIVRCPSCGKETYAQLRVCPHCSKDLPPHPVQMPEPSRFDSSYVIERDGEIVIYAKARYILFAPLFSLLCLWAVYAFQDGMMHELGLPFVVFSYLAFLYLLWIGLVFVWHRWGPVKRKPLMRLTPVGLFFPKHLKSPFPWHEIADIEIHPITITVRFSTIEYEAVTLRFENPQKLKRTMFGRLLCITGGWIDDYQFNVNKVWPMDADQAKDLILECKAKWQLPPADRPAPVDRSTISARSYSRNTQAQLLMAAFIPLVIFGVNFAWTAWLGGYAADGRKAYRKGDYETAYSVYRWAAPLGHAAAQTNLARMYAEGDGVTLDPDKAVYWYKRGAEEDLESAYEWLAEYWSARAYNPDEATPILNRAERIVLDVLAGGDHDSYLAVRLGYILLRHGRTSEPIWELARAASFRPKSWEYYDYLGNAFAAHGNRIMALKTWNRAFGRIISADDRRDMEDKIRRFKTN